MDKRVLLMAVEYKGRNFVSILMEMTLATKS
ncbi:hypothetical protein JOC86_001009 [Bacillus pakistanensis]|uniref:Uncharacterized protein n=1 Tax=Rossellomorea pakistanensis TaxID=992288 RepID=A0ABS2N9F0_9BACI|nr:hypothetical protein [Bacillus pakistanensis]